MKTALIVIFNVLLLSAGAQSFHRGAVVFDLSSGLEAFSTSQQYSFNGPMSDTIINSQAASKNASIGLEIGLSKRIGIGVRGKMNSFFPDLDAVTRKRTAINSTDLLLSLNLHPVVRKHLDLVIGADFGLSAIDFESRDFKKTLMSSRGHYFAPYVCPRFYWGRFGFHLKASLPSVYYNNFNNNSESPGSVSIAGFKASGFGFGAGIQLRLF